MKQLEIRLARRKQAMVIHVMGVMERSDVSRFEEKIHSLIGSGKNKIVLELAALDYIPSSGLGAIIGSVRQSRRNGGDIKIGGTTPFVYELFETIGFTTLFETYATEEAALDMFGEE